MKNWNVVKVSLHNVKQMTKVLGKRCDLHLKKITSYKYTLTRTFPFEIIKWMYFPKFLIQSRT